MKKRILSILLAMTMLLGLIPFAVSADEPEMVYITISDDSQFITDSNGTPMAYFAVELSQLEAVNLSDYGLDEYIYDSNMDGTPEITALHLYIYIHEVVLGLDWSNVTVTGSAGSIYFADGLFGYSDENLRYDLNGAYPSVDGWGTTADQIVLSAGDFLNVAHYTSWAFWGDSNTGFHYFADQEGAITFDYEVVAGEVCDVKVIRSFSDWSNGGLPAFADEPYFTVYYGATYGDATGTVTTDDYGNAAITFPSAGEWCIWTDGGYGCENPVDIVSSPALATVNVKEQDVPQETLSFASAPGLSFREYIGMQLLVNKSLADSYDRVWIEAVQADPAGDVTTTLEGTPFLGEYLIFEQQVLSWSMTENITLTLYAEKDGVREKGEVFSASVEDLALEKIASYAADSNTTAVTALVDMLNYGAAVQTAFDHNADALPNTRLGHYTGTTTTPNFNAVNSITGEGSVKVIKDSISLQAKVEIQLLFQTDISAYTLIAKAGDTEASVVVDAESFTAYGWTLVRIAVAADKMRDTYTIALYDADGKAVSQVYNVSVEAYGADQLSGIYNDVVVAMMRYGDSVAAI